MPVNISIPQSLRGWNIGNLLLDKIVAHNLPPSFKGAVNIRVSGGKRRLTTDIQSANESGTGESAESSDRARSKPLTVKQWNGALTRRSAFHYCGDISVTFSFVCNLPRTRSCHQVLSARAQCGLPTWATMPKQLFELAYTRGMRPRGRYSFEIDVGSGLKRSIALDVATITMLAYWNSSLSKHLKTTQKTQTPDRIPNFYKPLRQKV